MMAPSHFPDMLHHNKESLVLPWLESFTPSTQVLPTFMVLESSQFSFKLPPQPTTSLGGDDDSEPVRRSNTWKYTVPVRHAWVYDPTLSYQQVTVYTAWQVLSHIIPFFSSSLLQFFHIFCRRIMCWLGVHDTSQPQPQLLWSSQLCLLAAAANQSQTQELNNTVLGFKLPPSRLAGLSQTQSFHQVPLSLPQVHTILMHGTGTEARENSECDVGCTFEIDEMSPDEDKCLAESVIHNKSDGTSECYSIPRVLIHCLYSTRHLQSIQWKPSCEYVWPKGWFLLLTITCPRYYWFSKPQKQGWIYN